MICKRMRMAAVHSINREDRKMKKILIFAAIVAVLLLSSCQKEVPVENVKADISTVVEPPVFTATISPGTKTTVDAQTGKVSWEKDDEITIIDKASKSATYSVESIDGSTGRATFKYKSGANLGGGPYKATYGEKPLKTQTYNQKPGKLHMKAESDTTILNFKVQCGLLEINLTKSGASVKSVAVSSAPNGALPDTYTLNCSDESIETQKSFYIAVPAGKYHKIVITDKDGKDCTLTAASGIAVDTNHIKPVTFDDSKLVFKPNPLPGVFSVGNGKKVRFSRGNLVAIVDGKGKPVAWKFAAHQYDRLGTGGANQKIGSAAGDVDLFGWSTNNKFGIDTSRVDSDYSGNFNDWGKAIDENIWFTLKGEEWAYLFGDNDEREGAEKYQYPVKVCGIENCLVLAPDNYKPLSDINVDEISESKWPDLEAKGLVCLPPTGKREESVVDLGFIGNGYYWSSTGGSSSLEAGYMGWKGIKGSSTPPTVAYNAYRHIGISVRLVTEVK